MFHKRVKKHFPPGTFIPTKARIAAIIQLCIAFSYFLWIASQPFLGDLFAIRSEMALFETLFGTRTELNVKEKEKLERHRDRFASLPQDHRHAIESHYQVLQEKNNTSPGKKLQSMVFLIIGAPPFALALLLFSIAIPLLLLLRVEGAAHACWLLPLWVFFAVLERPAHPPPANEGALFPSEQMLLERHNAAPLKAGILEQYQQLQAAWQLYLVEEWGKEIPAKQPELFAQQVEQGEFAFTLSRANAKTKQQFSLPSEASTHLPLLPLYLLWSVAFAWTAQYLKEKADSIPPKIPSG